MVIIKCKPMLRTEEFVNLYHSFVEMAKNGLILLPDYCELLNEVPADTEIVVVKEKE